MKGRVKGDWRVEGGERVEDYLWRYGLEGGVVERVLKGAVEAGDRVLEAVWRVFVVNGDKGDFFESLKIFGKFMVTKGNPMLVKIEELLVEGGMKSAEIGKALTAFGDEKHVNYSTCMEAKELFDVMEDVEEFVDTIRAVTKKVK